MGTLILLRPVVSMASAPPRYASHWIALPCSPLITRKREKSWDVLMDASYQSWACAVVLPKCTTPVANIRKNVQNQVARIRWNQGRSFYLCSWWRVQFVLYGPALLLMILCCNFVLGHSSKTEPVIFSKFRWECEPQCSANGRLLKWYRRWCHLNMLRNVNKC